MGYVALHCGPWRRPRQSCVSYEHLEQIHCHGHPWFDGDLAGFYPNICERRSQNWERFQHRARRNHPCHVYFTSLLCNGIPLATTLSHARPCLEVRQTDVLSTNLPPRAGDSEVQCAGLSAKNGTIPEGGQKGAASTKDAETAGICFQRWRRRRSADEGLECLRHHKGKGSIWRNGQLKKIRQHILKQLPSLYLNKANRHDCEGVGVFASTSMHIFLGWGWSRTYRVDLVSMSKSQRS